MGQFASLPGRRWAVVAVVASAILLASVVRPGDGVADPGPFGLFTRDLWLHAGAYLVLELTVIYAVVDSERVLAFPVVVTPGATFGYGLFVEGVQLLVPYRAFSVPDLLANAVGVVVALGCYTAMQWLAVPRADETE